MVFVCEETSTGGELYFIRSTHNDLQIRANIFGQVSTSHNKKGWEVWRFVSSNRGDETFFISPWTHSQFYLSSFPEGRVTTTRDPYRWGLWKLEKETNGTEGSIRIRSVDHDRFLQLEDGRLSTVEPLRVISNKCWWNLQSAHSDNYYLHCIGRNRQLGCPKTIEEAPFATETFGNSDVWIIQKADQGDDFIIRAQVNGWYLHWNEGSSQVTLSEHPGDEGWQLTHHPSNGSVVIQSPSGGTLVCSQDGRIQMDDDNAATLSNSTYWKLVPVMPDTKTRQQLAAFAGASLATMTLGMATPHFVLGFFHFLGFTSHGIQAGSFAAHEMSRVAKSHGGTIPSGGWVSILQSIGILGLDTTWYLVAMVVGSLMSALFFLLVLRFTGILQGGTSDPCTSGIVPSESIGGILSTLDDFVYHRRTARPSTVEEQTLTSTNTLDNHPQAPTGSEIVVNRNRPMDALSICSGSMFADASSTSRASRRGPEGQQSWSQ